MWVGRRALPHLNLLLHNGSNNPQGEHAVRDLQVFGKLQTNFWAYPHLLCLVLAHYPYTGAFPHCVGVGWCSSCPHKFASIERELGKEHLKPSSNSIQIIDKWGGIHKNWIKPAGLARHPDINDKFDFITGHTLASKLRSMSLISL